MNTPAPASPIRLHVGCGRTILEGWTNLDVTPLPGVDIVADLETCRQKPLPLEDNSVSEFLLSHVLEHIRDAMGLMQELYRVALPDAKMTVRIPYGSSDDAWEDPTHVQPYFLSSFLYFSQPAYWRADYGYRGDWQAHRVTLTVSGQRYKGKTAPEIMHDVMHLRNIVQEMVVELSAIKPMREPKRELLVQPQISLTLA